MQAGSERREKSVCRTQRVLCISQIDFHAVVSTRSSSVNIYFKANSARTPNKYINRPRNDFYRALSFLCDNCVLCRLLFLFGLAKIYIYYRNELASYLPRQSAERANKIKWAICMPSATRNLICG